MPIQDTVGAFANVPSNDLRAAMPFWERLGFEQTGGDSNCIIMTGRDREAVSTIRIGRSLGSVQFLMRWGLSWSCQLGFSLATLRVVWTLPLAELVWKSGTAQGNHLR